MGDLWLYIQSFLKHATLIGTIVPSSKQLVGKLVKGIDFEHSKNIVELGAATGVVTKEILKKMKEDQRLLCFEVDPDLFSSLKKIDDKRLILVNGKAEDLSKNVAKYNFGDVDCIISTLPIALFSKEQNNILMKEVKRVLKPGGKFLQIQYSPISYRLMKRNFKNVKLNFAPFNFPPSVIYVCSNPAM